MTTTQKYCAHLRLTYVYQCELSLVVFEQVDCNLPKTQFENISFYFYFQRSRHVSLSQHVGKRKKKAAKYCNVLKIVWLCYSSESYSHFYFEEKLLDKLLFSVTEIISN